MEEKENTKDVKEGLQDQLIECFWHCPCIQTFPSFQTDAAWNVFLENNVTEYFHKLWSGKKLINPKLERTEIGKR